VAREAFLYREAEHQGQVPRILPTEKIDQSRKGKIVEPAHGLSSAARKQTRRHEGHSVGANLVDGILDATDLFNQESHHRHHRWGGLLLNLHWRWTHSSHRLLPTTATRGHRCRRLSYHATVLWSERIWLMRASLKGRFSTRHECTRHRVHSTTKTTKEPRVRDSGSNN
jgi:hypothetical protein